GPFARVAASSAAVPSTIEFGTTWVAIPRLPASAPDIGSPSIAKRDARERPTRSAKRCSAVRVEPVSAANSLLTGKITGNFAKTGHPIRFSHLINTEIQ